MAPERCKVGGAEVCQGKNFQQVVDGSVHTDYQEVVIQESASQLVGSHVPRSLLIKLQHDLVDRCQPGDEVIVVGNLLAQWHQACMADIDVAVGMSLEAHSIRVVQDKSSSAWSSVSSTGATAEGGPSLGAELDDDKYRQEFVAFWRDPSNSAAPIAARDQICKAVCPKLYGLAIVKLALLMTLIGGLSQEDHDKRRNRERNNGNSRSCSGSSVPAAHFKSDEPEAFHVDQNEQNPAPSTYYGDADGAQSKNYNKQSSQSVQTRRRGQSHLLLGKFILSRQSHHCSNLFSFLTQA